MWFTLKTALQYRFEGEISPVAFFQHLPHLLAPADTLVLGCYDARSDIRDFLASVSIPSTPKGLLETCSMNDDAYPHSATFHLHPTDATVQQLIHFAGSVTPSIDLCDHIAGYSAEHPLFIYHGTFWEPLFISTRIPRSNVEAFSQGIDVPFEEIDFYKTYSPSKAAPSEPSA